MIIVAILAAGIAIYALVDARRTRAIAQRAADRPPVLDLTNVDFSTLRIDYGEFPAKLEARR